MHARSITPRLLSFMWQIQRIVVTLFRFHVFSLWNLRNYLYSRVRAITSSKQPDVWITAGSGRAYASRVARAAPGRNKNQQLGPTKRPPQSVRGPGKDNPPSQHYTLLFSNAPELAELREAYAIPDNVLRDPERRRLMTAFFSWASWPCAANRPGGTASYTQNWPPELLVGNVPTGSSVLWSVVSFVLLLAASIAQCR